MPSCAWLKPSAIPLEFASEILSAIFEMFCSKVSAFVINLKLGKAGDLQIKDFESMSSPEPT